MRPGITPSRLRSGSERMSIKGAAPAMASHACWGSSRRSRRRAGSSNSLIVVRVASPAIPIHSATGLRADRRAARAGCPFGSDLPTALRRRAGGRMLCRRVPFRVPGASKGSCRAKAPRNHNPRVRVRVPPPPSVLGRHPRCRADLATLSDRASLNRHARRVPRRACGGERGGLAGARDADDDGDAVAAACQPVDHDALLTGQMAMAGEGPGGRGLRREPAADGSECHGCTASTSTPARP
jgi:hypothetical protein